MSDSLSKYEDMVDDYLALCAKYMCVPRSHGYGMTDDGPPTMVRRKVAHNGPHARALAAWDAWPVPIYPEDQFAHLTEDLRL